MTWECPRCQRINAEWVGTCQCPPPTYVTDHTDISYPVAATGTAVRGFCSCGLPLFVCRGSHTFS